MLDEIHDYMEVYGHSLPPHIQQGKCSICIEGGNEMWHNNTWLQGQKTSTQTDSAK
jgi:hypothetical protein